MKLFRILIPVPDIDRAEKFYAALFGASGERVSPERHYFKSGSVIVACYAPGDDGRPFRPLETETYFAVAGLEAMHAKVLAAGAKLSAENQDHHGHLGRIEQRPWGERSFYVSDPFGNPLCFVDEKTLFTGRP